MGVTTSNTAHLFDSHVHLDAPDFAPDFAAVLARAEAAGVTRFLSVGAGYGVESAARAVKLAQTYANIWASVGIHPHDAAVLAETEELQALITDARVVAVGETGLDYHYHFATPEVQQSRFREQIALARCYKKPLIIHCREAAADCLRILQEESARDVGGVFHCYSEDFAFWKKLNEIQFIVSFPGVLTFKKSEHTRITAQQIPLENILLETDAPFLAPEPYRGKRAESSFMVKTAECLAKVKNISFEEVAHITTSNALRFFKIS